MSYSVPNILRTRNPGAIHMKLNLPVILLFASFIFTTQAAHAADKELLDILLGNGAITQDQYDELLSKPVLEKADVEDVKVGLSPSRWTNRNKNRYSTPLPSFWT